MNQYNLENTQLNVEGEINSLVYHDKAFTGKSKESVLTKIFK